MRPPCSATMARQMASPRPTPPRRAVVEFLEQALEVALRQAGAEVLHRHHELAAVRRARAGAPACAAACGARRSPAGWRAPARSARRRRARAAGRPAGRPSPGGRRGAACRRRSTEPAISPSEHQSRSSVSAAALQARHLQHLGDQLGHRRCDSRKMLCASARALVRRHALAALGEAGGRARDHRERRAQVVRDRGEQRAADALGLGLDGERRPAPGARARTVSVSHETISPTASIMAKVSRYCGSSTWKVPRGGTKKKLNAATLRTEAATTGPRPQRSATSTTASRYTIAMLTSSSHGAKREARPACRPRSRPAAHA